MSKPECKLYWEIKCELDGEPYCSSIIEADTEQDALRKFHAESGVAEHVEVVGVAPLGQSTSPLAVLLSRVDRKSLAEPL